MANNYLEFSEKITGLTKEEVDWMREQLEETTLIPEDGSEEWYGPLFLAGRDFEANEELGITEFSSSFSGPGPDGKYDFWIYSEEDSNLDHVALFVQAFLKQFRPYCYWTLTYATLCDRPRIGAFGGGSLVVTATDMYWHNAYQAIADRVADFDRLPLFPGDTEGWKHVNPPQPGD